jgi:hypothetical protein
MDHKNGIILHLLEAESTQTGFGFWQPNLSNPFFAEFFFGKVNQSIFLTLTNQQSQTNKIKKDRWISTTLQFAHFKTSDATLKHRVTGVSIFYL